MPDPNTTDPPGLGTRCVHAGYRAEPGSPAVAAPVVTSTTFLLDDEAVALRLRGEGHRATIYGRETNPTVGRVEARLAALDGAEGALLFASGMAALHALLMTVVGEGDRVVAARTLFGGTLGLLRELLPTLGAELELADLVDADAAAAALATPARLVLVESTSNPLLEVADVPALAALARGAGARLAVDATFPTPIGQRPLELGADVVVHSASKGLGGHSDVIGGALCGDLAFLEEAWGWRTRAGGCMDPRAADALGRGLKTLHLRVPRQSATATAVARMLAARDDVTGVLHPSLESHPTRAVAQRVLDHPGGLVGFVVPAGLDAAAAVVRRLELFTEAGSLGGVESLASLPRTLSHAQVPPAELDALVVAPGLVRLSVGVEDEADLLRDLAQALDRR